MHSKPPLNLFDRYALEAQRESFGKVPSCLKNRFSLTRNINLRAECDVAITLGFDNRD